MEGERLEASDCQLAVFCQCRAQSAYPPPPPGCRRHLPHDCLILSPRRHVHPPLSILSCQPYQLGKYKIINHPGRRPKKNSALTRSLPYSAAAAAASVGWRRQRNSRRCGGMWLPTEQRRHTQNYLHLQKLGLMTLLLFVRSWFTKSNSSKICL